MLLLFLFIIHRVDEERKTHLYIGLRCQISAGEVANDLYLSFFLEL